jgi:predicted nucleic acid-binding Zn ribbon protein
VRTLKNPQNVIYDFFGFLEMSRQGLIFAVHAKLTTMYKPINPEHYDSHCLECGEPIYGRADKKFCNSDCRNSWHAHLRSEGRRKKHRTLNTLSVNYAILENLLRLQKTSCPLGSLLEMGFRPEYVTHTAEKIGRHTEHRCFDIAYYLSAAKIFNIHRV